VSRFQNGIVYGLIGVVGLIAAIGVGAFWADPHEPVVKTRVVHATVTAEPTSTPTVTATKKVKVRVTKTERVAVRVTVTARADRQRSLSSGSNYADGGTVWDRLAQCESGGNWAINTGNGYYGGLQFSLSSWRAVGGSGYPHQASRETQIAMGQRLQAAQGWGAWPSCSAQLGLS
jgi:hypothetical protein